MASITIEYSGLEGTGASVGRSGAHTLIADRPEGKASGSGLGFNGAELLALSLGGCFCNDIHYTAEEMNVRLSGLKVQVKVDLGGEPLRVSAATVYATCRLADGASADELLARARKRCTIANSLRHGIDVEFE